MVLGGFDLLRWRRGSPSELSGLQGTQAAPAEAEVPDQTDPGAEMARPSGPFEMTAIGTDPRVGLWWYIHESKILLFQLPGQQWPPCSVVPLPSTVAAQCVAPLTGAVQQDRKGWPWFIRLFQDQVECVETATSNMMFYFFFGMARL
eukprot:g12348.t1